MKKLTSKVVLALALAVAASTGVAADADAASKLKVKNDVTVKGTESTINLAKGKKVKLSTSSALKKVTSSNKKIAAVSFKAGKKNATVTGKKKGSAKIALVDKKGKKATIKVSVKANPVTKVAFTKKSVDVKKGKTVTLKTKVTAKSGANKTLKFTSANPKIATVDVKTGKVKGVKVGTVKITAKATDGSKKKATCTVNVTQKYTAVTVKSADVKASIEVKGVPTAVENDVLAALKIVGVKDAALTVNVDGVDKVVKYEVNGETGKLTVDGKPFASVADKKGQVSVKITTSMAKAVKSLKSVAALAGEKYTKVVVNVAGHTFTGFTANASGSKVTFLDGTEKYDAIPSKNTLYIKGALSDTLAKDLAKVATVETVQLAK